MLGLASLYEAFQIGLGFSGARKKAIGDYLTVKPGDTVLDIGCGPGKILTYLPEGVEYHGFDVDQNYIDHAKKTYEGRGKFYCRAFDDTVLDEFNNVDLIMFNGVVHYLPDSLANEILATTNKALSENGTVFTLDGCYRDGQNKIAKKLLDMDRGEHIRTQSAYETIMNKHFSNVGAYIREDIFSLPYTFLIMTAQKAI